MNPNEEIVGADQEVVEGAERHGKVGWAVLWLLGVPLPVLLVLYFLTGGGCNGG